VDLKLIGLGDELGRGLEAAHVGAMAELSLIHLQLLFDTLGHGTWA